MIEHKGELRSKDGVKVGEWKVTVDPDLKLVKNVIYGSLDEGGYQEYINCIVNELKKFKQGEPLYFVDTTHSDTKFMKGEVMRITKEFGTFSDSYCKRCAGVIPSFVFRKMAEIFNTGRSKYLATEAEAMKFLLNG